ncbi:MAG TPA: hypothetical protein VIH42_04035 [Thermoguttaceae bacterium]
MNYKAFFPGLLLLALCTAGCSKPQSAISPEAEQNITAGQWTPSEKVSYKWPDDFKLPLEFTIETPQAPKEVQGPFPPLEEEKK